MGKLLVIVDMQNDFVHGALDTEEARAIIPAIQEKLRQATAENKQIIFTRDTHHEDYLQTQEGKFLPVKHCIENTWGWNIIPELVEFADQAEFIFDKPSFGSYMLAEHVAVEEFEEVELCGVCTDICVVSNVLGIKMFDPEVLITVDALACAGITPASHTAALTTMRMCQVNVTNFEG
jgi:nicotinamidase-related amidase